MDLLGNHVFLSRLQFALTTMFHIIWPLTSIGLAAFLVYLEAMWLKKRDPLYLRQYKFWAKLFVLGFAVGVVSGIPLEFQFGTNWGPFSRSVGNFFGQLLGFEGTMAFMLESAFLWIMIFGWKKVSPRWHFFATCMVAFAASLSAFWIMAANSWMQTPAGGVMVDGVFQVTDWWAALFTPDLVYSFSHMWVACVQTTIFAVGAVSAWFVLKKKHTEFFSWSLKAMTVAALIIAPLQAVLGDASGQAIGKTQPAKVAAIESHWNTNPPGEGADWSMIAWPDPENERNFFSIDIPYGLSLLITHSLTGTVPGLKDFPKEDRPPIVLPFYTFRLMVGIGFAMVFLALATAWAWWRGKLLDPDQKLGRKLLWGWVAFGPLGFVAVEMGWMTREIGRQPWTVYGLVRTSEAASSLPTASVGWTLAGFATAYTFLFLVFCYFALRILRKGPDMTLDKP
jgi:cytochrome d ubiquinol oxidase subunit I